MRRLYTLLILLIILTSTSEAIHAQLIAGSGSVKGSGTIGILPAAGGGGGGGSIGAIPCGTTFSCSLGWGQIASSTYQGLCPTYPEIQGTAGCSAVVSQWGSAWNDTNRNQLVLFGGGHTDYFGNEVYRFDLASGHWSLAKDATHNPNLTGPAGCSNTNSDGTPNSRHDNDGMVYVATSDFYLIHGGNLANCGSFTNNYWKLDPISLAWTNFTVPGTSPNPGSTGGATEMAYDARVGNLAYMVDGNDGSGTFWSWNPTSNVWTLLTSALANGCQSPGFEHTSVIDPVRRLYFCIGAGKAMKIKIDSPFTVTSTLNMTGCGTTKADNGPGLTYYDPDGTLVLWSGGNTIFEYNPDTDSCTSTTFTGGPGAQQAEGTYKRLAYYPGPGVLLLVNAFNQNVFYLRLKDQNTDNFQFRAHQPGVINVEGFDTTASFTQPADQTRTGMQFATNSGDCPSFPTTPCIVRDTTTFVSGGSAMRYDIKPFVTQDGGDYYMARFNCAYGVAIGTCTPTFFGANSTFYIQMAVRYDTNWVNTFWPPFGNNQDTAPKLFIVHQVDGANQPDTCDVTQATVHNEHGWAIPTGYVSCGAQNMYVLPDGTANQGTPVSYQGGWTAPSPFTGFECDYQSGNRPSTPNCFVFTPNTWYTLYFKISLGAITAGNAPLTFQGYVAPYGTQLKRFINVTSNLSIPVDANLERFTALTLTQYMTGKTSNNNPAASAWYDELIISTSPIPSPAGVTP